MIIKLNKFNKRKFNKIIKSHKINNKNWNSNNKSNQFNKSYKILKIDQILIKVKEQVISNNNNLLKKQ